MVVFLIERCGRAPTAGTTPNFFDVAPERRLTNLQTTTLYVLTRNKFDYLNRSSYENAGVLLEEDLGEARVAT